MKASTAGGRWGKKIYQKKKKAPVFTPSCGTPADPSDSAKNHRTCRATELGNGPKRCTQAIDSMGRKHAH